MRLKENNQMLLQEFYSFDVRDGLKRHENIRFIKGYYQE